MESGLTFEVGDAGYDARFKRSAEGGERGLTVHNPMQCSKRARGGVSIFCFEPSSIRVGQVLLAEAISGQTEKMEDRFTLPPCRHETWIEGEKRREARLVETHLPGT